MELTWVDPPGLCSELIPELIFKTMVDAKLVGEALTEWLDMVEPKIEFLFFHNEQRNVFQIVQEKS
jgi:hypothetical protein